MTTAVGTCLLVECCWKMDACWTVATQSACLPIFCHSTMNSRWSGASLSVIPAGVLSHYQPCLLIYCLTIDHTCWCCASLSAELSGVVPLYRPCLLVWYPTISQLTAGSRPLRPTILLVKCRWKKNGYKSCATLTEVTLHQKCLLTPCHSQICLHVQCNYIRHA